MNQEPEIMINIKGYIQRRLYLVVPFPEKPPSYKTIIGITDQFVTGSNPVLPIQNQKFLCSIKWLDSNSNKSSDHFFYSNNGEYSFLWTNFMKSEYVYDNNLGWHNAEEVSCDLLAYCKRGNQPDKYLAMWLLLDMWHLMIVEENIDLFKSITAIGFLSVPEILAITNEIMSCKRALVS